MGCSYMSGNSIALFPTVMMLGMCVNIAMNAKLSIPTLYATKMKGGKSCK
jgi:hypothetical protein